MRKVQELIKSARFWRFVNLYQIFFWIALIPIAFITGLADQTWFVTLISLIALALAAQSSWQASRNEEKEDTRDPETDNKRIREIVKDEVDEELDED